MSVSKATPVAVIGAGAWGTALAWLVAGKGEGVRLWVFEAAVAAEIASTRENRTYLPGIRLPESLEATTSLADAVRGAESLIFAVPSHAAAGVLAHVAPLLEPEVPIISATKGIETERLRVMSAL
ncbi:MAG TPA: 2-dehydropantoate 2-reductase N-terminal domain-containing protein, partial [Nitrospirales bacterium]|nr:2-dehydropantoate 2-reductase N-terminal domain-containing protein [Nitrospirales bacterium]